MMYNSLIPRPHLVFNVVHSLRTLKFVAILNAHNSIIILYRSNSLERFQRNKSVAVV